MPNLEVENSLLGKVAGVDEVGYGALCGPVVVGAVILDRSKDFSYVNDSKLMSSFQRERAYSKIVADHIYSIGIASSEEVDRLNVREATMLAYKRAIGNLLFVPDVCLIDGIIKVEGGVNIVGGDRKSASIAAASIAAKVFRDSLMQMLHLDHPNYMWLSNKGYGTPGHVDAVRRFGPTHHHRKSFLKNIINSVPRGTLQGLLQVTKE